ncbi:DUF3019 domain-containing protein [Paraneptunicella aestuarii]|uniref:DUF3019 domain-containing protein n=1 Tax=Paraneptunicella aestuarii TaxID=2831148 RepID=UPI001E32B015|nr:DUF3019 domain-containing protein [Paraneptunicella aestuarii]UAA38365.1 DUF3019 domain-containing protein [Paraneptunicella aestuarii]
MSNGILLFIMYAGLFHSEVNALPTEWDVIPSACVVDRPGDFCRLEFEIITTAGERASLSLPACLYLEKELIQCWEQLPEHITASVEIKETNTLLLVDKNKEVLLEKKLEVKSIHPVRQRRRVRSPWSMF